MKIAFIGSTNIDLVSYVDNIPQAGETRSVKEYECFFGGKGANQAIAAKQLGADVIMVTALGGDLFGTRCLENFTKRGVNTNCVQILPDRTTGVATIIVEENGQNRILFYGGANATFTPELFYNVAAQIKDAKLIVLQLEIPLETVYTAIRFAKKNSIPILLNPAPARTELDMELVRLCDFLIPNETELAILTDRIVATVEDVRSAAHFLLNKGLKNIIVTMGSKGSLLISKDDEYLVKAAKVRAVDSTGAGDGYIGAFAEYYVKSGNIIEAMKKASNYAALSVTRKGAQDSYLSKERFVQECNAICGQ